MGGAYSKYRIDGGPTEPDTFFNKIRRSLIEVIRKETRDRSIRAQTSKWIRFRKDEDLVELVFNSLMTNIYNLDNLDEIVLEMINNMKYQIENPAFLQQIHIRRGAIHGYKHTSIEPYEGIELPSITRLVGPQEGDNKSKE